MSALRKNVASQVLTFGLVNAATGAALTGATFTGKAWVTGDGTQAGFAGTFTELGNGQYKYVPTQGETNVTSFGLMIAPTSAVPVNLHCWTANYDTTAAAVPANVTQLLGTAWLTPSVAGTPDVNAKQLGGTAQTGRDIGASVLLSSGTGTGQLDFTSGVVKANATQWLGGTIPAVNVTGVPLVDLKYTLGTLSPATAGTVRADAVTGLTAADVAAIKAKTDNLPADPADASDIAASFSTVNSTLATIAGYIDTEVASIITAISSTGVVLTSAERNAVADALLDRTSGVETGLTVRQAHRLQVAAAAGKLSGAATTSVTIRNAVADSKDRIVATVDADGNRSAITLDLT